MKLSEMSPEQLMDCLHKYVHELESTGKAWAEANATRKFLDKVSKSILASCRPDEGTVADREASAHMHTRYQDHLKGCRESDFKADSLNVEYKAVSTKIEVLRSAFAMKRSQLEKMMT